MRIETLREFRDLAHSLNFTATAKQLHMTQPKLSKHMIELEEEIGFKLFRRGKDIELTMAGKNYLATVAKILHMHDVAITESRRIDSSNTEEVRLATGNFNDEARQLLLHTAQRYRDSEDAAPVHFVSDPSKTSMEALRDNTADVALVMGGAGADILQESARDKGLSIEEVFRYPLVVLGRADVLEGVDSLSVPDLDECVFAMPANQSFNIYRNALLEIFNSIDSNTDYNIYPVDSFDDLLIAKADEELLILTPSMAKNEQTSSFEDLKIVPFSDGVFSIGFYIAYRKEEERPEVLSFVDSVIELSDAMKDGSSDESKDDGR